MIIFQSEDWERESIIIKERWRRKSIYGRRRNNGGEEWSLKKIWVAGGSLMKKVQSRIYDRLPEANCKCLVGKIAKGELRRKKGVTTSEKKIERGREGLDSIRKPP